MTLAVLARFGVIVLRGGESGDESFRTHGPLHAPSGHFAIEPDASAAAVALAAACITGGECSVAGLTRDSLQGDVRIALHLAAFGCAAGFDARGIHAGGDIRRGAELDLSGEPDLAPALAAVAATAALRHGSRSRLSGLGTLQGKESARIDVLREGLSALGLDVRSTLESLDIAPGKPTRGPLVLDPRGDHRMAFAFALLGLARDEVDVSAPECVRKSWPGFWDDFARAGANVVSRR
jgi:3-phosphoshikimate 1-carboxyvinyltransferase